MSSLTEFELVMFGPNITGSFTVYTRYFENENANEANEASGAFSIENALWLLDHLHAMANIQPFNLPPYASFRVLKLNARR